MSKPFAISIALAVFAALAAGSACAHDYLVRALAVDHPWARATAVGQSVGGAYLTIGNGGALDDRLVSGSSPIATEIQLHAMTMDHGVMRMRRLTGGIVIPAHGVVKLGPGGLHIMLVGLKRPLQSGERVPLTLQFQRAGKLTVEVAVAGPGAMAPMGDMAPMGPLGK